MNIQAMKIIAGCIPRVCQGGRGVGHPSIIMYCCSSTSDDLLLWGFGLISYVRWPHSCWASLLSRVGLLIHLVMICL